MQGPPMMPGGMGGPGGNDPLLQLNEQNMIFFLLQNSDMVEDPDQQLFKKSAVNIGRNLFFTLVLGTTLNIQIKKVPKLNFLKWNKYLRFLFRIPILISPYLLFKQETDKRFEDLFYMHRKYYSRIIKYQKSGNMQYLDPDGKLQKKMEQQNR